MSERTRTHTTTRQDELHDDVFGRRLDLEDDVTDEDIEAFLNHTVEQESRPSFFNLPTVAGLATIGVGVTYLLQRYDLLSTSFEIGALVGPWLVGVLIILLGFVFLSWKPRRTEQTAAARRRAAERKARQRRERPVVPPERVGTATAQESATARTVSGRKQFARSRGNRKIAGVCGGIGEYFGIDPTIVRIAFVIGTVVATGMAIPLYLVLAFVMPNPQPPRLQHGHETADDERVIVIRS